MRLPLSALDKHYVLSRRALACPDGWRHDRFEDLHLFTARHIRRHPLQDESGRQIGMIVGWIIGGDGVLRDGSPVQAGQGTGLAGRTAELCGRFLVVGRDEPEAAPLLLPDACGLLPAVYAPSEETVAGTPAMLADLFGLAPDESVRAAFPIPERFGWIPFGRTPWEGAWRLLPRHALDLERFSVSRFEEDAPGDGERGPIGPIFDRVAANCTTLARDPDTRPHLTAGYDSRMVLSAWLAGAEPRPFVTLRTPGPGGRIDVATAATLARRCGLAHEVRTWQPPEKADLDEWHARTGYCISDHVAALATTLKGWNPGEIQVTGTCGEVGRAFYWDGADITRDMPDAADLVARLGVTRADWLLHEAHAWLETLPEMSAPDLWDRAYVEQRLGCWGGPSVFGSSLHVPSMSPFNSRAIISRMLAMPAAERAGERFARAFVARADPGLARIATNTPLGLRKLVEPKATLKSIAKVYVPRALLKFLK